MIEFLDPRSHIAFKKIFMDHPAILKSFLNAVLPFESEKEWIVSLSVIPREETRELEILKDAYVQVKCFDAEGGCFIVEIQMNWTNVFVSRVLLNASIEYARQRAKVGDSGDLTPVYGLSILDDSFPVTGELAGGEKLQGRPPHTCEYYHHYRLVHAEDPNRTIDHLQVIFVELPAFRKVSPAESQLEQWAWLRFMIETGDVGTEKGISLEQFEKTVLISQELKEAAELAKASGYSRAQLAAYEHFWDHVSRERTLMQESYRKGMEWERARLQRMEKMHEEKVDAKQRADDAISGLAKMRAAMKKAGLDPDKL